MGVEGTGGYWIMHGCMLWLWATSCRAGDGANRCWAPDLLAQIQPIYIMQPISSTPASLAESKGRDYAAPCAGGAGRGCRVHPFTAAYLRPGKGSRSGGSSAGMLMLPCTKLNFRLDMPRRWPHPFGTSTAECVGWVAAWVASSAQGDNEGGSSRQERAGGIRIASC